MQHAEWRGVVCACDSKTTYSQSTHTYTTLQYERAKLRLEHSRKCTANSDAKVKTNKAIATAAGTAGTAGAAPSSPARTSLRDDADDALLVSLKAAQSSSKHAVVQLRDAIAALRDGIRRSGLRAGEENALVVGHCVLRSHQIPCMKVCF